MYTEIAERGPFGVAFLVPSVIFLTSGKYFEDIFNSFLL